VEHETFTQLVGDGFLYAAAMIVVVAAVASAVALYDLVRDIVALPPRARPQPRNKVVVESFMRDGREVLMWKREDENEWREIKLLGAPHDEH
jgi:hypothetical protein